MPISQYQYIQMMTRMDRNKRGEPVCVKEIKPVDRELKLHDAIMKWCDSQFPKWKYIRARPDRESTIAAGCQDLTIFGHYPTCILVECKSKDGKLSLAQLSWQKEMELLGWTVFVVRSMESFLEVVAFPKQHLHD